MKHLLIASQTIPMSAVSSVEFFSTWDRENSNGKLMCRVQTLDGRVIKDCMRDENHARVGLSRNVNFDEMANSCIYSYHEALRSSDSGLNEIIDLNKILNTQPIVKIKS